MLKAWHGESRTCRGVALIVCLYFLSMKMPTKVQMKMMGIMNDPAHAQIKVMIATKIRPKSWPKMPSMQPISHNFEYHAANPRKSQYVHMVKMIKPAIERRIGSKLFMTPPFWELVNQNAKQP